MSGPEQHDPCTALAFRLGRCEIARLSRREEMTLVPKFNHYEVTVTSLVVCTLVLVLLMFAILMAFFILWMQRIKEEDIVIEED